MVRAVSIDQAYARLRRTKSVAYGYRAPTLREGRSRPPRPLGGAPTGLRHDEPRETGRAGEDTHGRSTDGRTAITRRGAFDRGLVSTCRDGRHARFGSPALGTRAAMHHPHFERAHAPLWRVRYRIGRRIALRVGREGRDLGGAAVF